MAIKYLNTRCLVRVDIMEKKDINNPNKLSITKTQSSDTLLSGKSLMDSKKSAFTSENKENSYTPGQFTNPFENDVPIVEKGKAHFENDLKKNAQLPLSVKRDFYNIPRNDLIKALKNLNEGNSKLMTRLISLIIKENPEVTEKEVSDILGLNITSLTPLVDELIEKGEINFSKLKDTRFLTLI